MSDNEWKELKSDDLPPDILTECYEFETYNNFIWESRHLLRIDILQQLLDGCRFRYRKPEPAEPLIVKSGETWVANWEGVDYLCTEPDNFDQIDIEGIEKSPDRLQVFENWKSFTGPNPDIVELTDDIAKLRPMVALDEKHDLCKLLAIIDHDFPYVVYDPRWENYHDKWNVCRLATAKELKQAQK